MPTTSETKERAIASALRQIRTRDYAAELRARGAAPIHEMAAVFDGKRVYVRAAGESRKRARRKPPVKVKAKVKAKKTAPRRR